MPRFIRNTAILAKIETTVGVDSVPTGAANALLVSNVSINPLNAQNVDRDLIRSYFGSSDQLVGTAYKEVGFDIELAGSGAAGTAPKWGPLLRACAFAETINAGVSAEYNPITVGQEAVTIYYYDDGVQHRLLGARGTFEIKAGIGARPVLSFRFIGIDGGDTAVANPSTTLTGWTKPLVITDPNTGDLTLGGALAASAVTGGVVYKSRGIDVNLGADVGYTALLGGDSVDVNGRNATAKFELDLSAAEEVTFMGNVKANVQQSVSLQHGIAAGNTILLWMPAVQLINPSKAEVNSRRLIGYDARVMPSAGNDELRIFAK
jgi:hypothetical protein